MWKNNARISKIPINSFFTRSRSLVHSLGPFTPSLWWKYRYDAAALSRSPPLNLIILGHFGFSKVVPRFTSHFHFFFSISLPLIINLVSWLCRSISPTRLDRWRAGGGAPIRDMAKVATASSVPPSSHRISAGPLKSGSMVKRKTPSELRVSTLSTHFSNPNSQYSYNFGGEVLMSMDA